MLGNRARLLAAPYHGVIGFSVKSQMKRLIPEEFVTHGTFFPVVPRACVPA